MRHGGSLARLAIDILRQAAHAFAEHWIAAGLPPGPLSPSLSPAGPGPPCPFPASALPTAACFACIRGMADRTLPQAELIAVLRSHEADLRARGVEAITLFGSHARGEATNSSNVDLAFRPSTDFSSGGFDHFGRFESLREHLAGLLGCDVDLVEEPAARPRLRRIIAEEGVRAF